MNQPLRIGLIGAGMVSRHHLIAWASIADQARVVAVADPSADNAARRATEFEIPKTYADAEAMLAATDLAAEVSDQTRRMVHENWRFRGYYRDAAAWLREGRIGNVKQAQLTLLTSGVLPGSDGLCPALERQPFMRREKRMLVAEVLIHHLDTLRMLLGPLCVTAAALSRSSEQLVGEDGAVIQLQAGNGAGVTVFASFAAQGHPATQIDRLEILGDKGAIRLDGARLTCSGVSPQERVYDLATEYQGSYNRTIAHFVQSLRDNTPFETAPQDNLETLRLVEDCYRLSGWEALP